MCFPVLASVRFLGLPWTAVAKYIAQFRPHDIWEGGRMPKFLGQFLASVRIRPILDSVSFRQIPWGSVDYQLIIYCWNSDTNVCGRVAGSQSSGANIYIKLKFAVAIIPILASASTRRLPWDSVAFRLHIYWPVQTEWYVGRGPCSTVP